MSRSREDLERWVKGIKLKEKVIADIGGEQKSIKDRANLIDCTVVEFDLPDWDLNEHWLNEDVKQKFDAIFCLEVMEYIYDPMTAIKNFKWMLKDGGVLFISTHWLYGLHKPTGTDFLRYSIHGIKQLLQISGFQVLKCEPRYLNKDSFQHLVNFYRSEGMKIDYNEGFDHSGHLITAIKGRLSKED